MWSQNEGFGKTSHVHSRFIILKHAYQVFNPVKNLSTKNHLVFISFITLAITSALSIVSVAPVGKYKP